MIKKPRGTIDISGNFSEFFFNFCRFLEDVSWSYGYSRVETPIFESKELFCRNDDDTSDMIVNEMYTFTDKGNREITLRPEGTASIARFVVEEKILHKEKHPLKYFYIGPMFRYERPQSGRQRQFYQYGIECISLESIYDEIEIILLAKTIVEKLNIKNTILKLNYIGNKETRKKWNIELKKYFKKNIDLLTQESQNRIEKNPLRILDDKIDSKKKVVKNAPTISNFLTKEEKEYIELFKNIMDKNSVKFEWDNTLVRGLDYYTGIVFEIVSNEKNVTIIGGGKYEKIFSEIGEDDYPCFGFALGMERTISIAELNSLDDYKRKNLIYFANLTKNDFDSFNIINNMRENGINVITSYDTNKLKQHFKISEKYNPDIILIYGDKEKENYEIIIKNQNTQKEEKIKLNSLIKKLKNN
ncbi:MAG: histidine--tRNA ligase [Mycoplasmoidaceae bacterium]